MRNGSQAQTDKKEVPSCGDSQTPNALNTALEHGDALSQILSSCSTDANIQDPTELLFIDMVARFLVTKDRRADIRRVAVEMMVRLLVSYATHIIMGFILAGLHSSLHVQSIPLLLNHT